MNDLGELQMDGRHVLYVEEVALLLRISRSAAYAAVASGEIPSVHIGKRRLVPTHAIRTLLLVDAGGSNG